MYHAPIRFPFTSLLFRKVIRDSRGFRIYIPDFLSPELNWIQQASNGCARGQEQTTRKNVVLTFNLVDEIHKTVVLCFENVVMQCLCAITQMEPAT